VIRTQEKWRFRPYTNDILIEYCSVWRNGECQAPGWIYTCDADYLFIVYQPSDLVKIYPVVQLKIAWNSNKEQWTPRSSEHHRSKPHLCQPRALRYRPPILEDEIRKAMRFDYQRKPIGGLRVTVRRQPRRPGVVPRLPRSDLRRPARGMGLVLSAAFADRHQVHERRGAPGAVLPRA